MNKFRLISIDQFWTTLNGSCFQFDYKKTKNDSNKGIYRYISID
jgi:hypothetical protein